MQILRLTLSLPYMSAAPSPRKHPHVSWVQAGMLLACRILEGVKQGDNDNNSDSGQLSKLAGLINLLIIMNNSYNSFY